MDCEKFAGDALYVCEAMRRLRDVLLRNTSLPELDVSIFENLEQCAHISLKEIAQREDKAIAKGKAVFKEDITEGWRQERLDELRGPNMVDMVALLNIVGKDGVSGTKNWGGHAQGSPGELKQKNGVFQAKKKLSFLDATDHQQTVELANAFHSQIEAVKDMLTKTGKGDTEAMEEAEDASRTTKSKFLRALSVLGTTLFMLNYRGVQRAVTLDRLAVQAKGASFQAKELPRNAELTNA